MGLERSKPKAQRSGLERADLYVATVAGEKLFLSKRDFMKLRMTSSLMTTALDKWTNSVKAFQEV